MLLTGDLRHLSLHALMVVTMLLALLALRRWPLLYALALWPGTVAHELLHYGAGLVTGARPVSLSVIPRRKLEGGWVLGSVQFLRLRWWNSVPVGLAPLALVPLSIVLFLHSTTLPMLSAMSVVAKALSVQGLVAGWPSPRDWAHAMVGLVVLILIMLVALLISESIGDAESSMKLFHRFFH